MELSIGYPEEHEARSARRENLHSRDRSWNRMALQAYYEVKPFVPEWLTFALRRWRVRYQRRKYQGIWPIDPSCAIPPVNWNGWPDNKQFAFILTHDVEWGEGQDKSLQLAQAEEQLGFRSAFYFVPRRYPDNAELREQLTKMNFEVGVHGLYHDGKLYRSHKVFSQRAILINEYMRAWGASGFRSPSMHHKLEWMHELEILYDASTFDVDPFEPQADGSGTIYPFLVTDPDSKHSYVELPYTLPQDCLLYLMCNEKDASIWKRKLDWVAQHGGMAMLITHPDYVAMGEASKRFRTYPLSIYEDLLNYVKTRYAGQYWQALPREVAQYLRDQAEFSRELKPAVREII